MNESHLIWQCRDRELDLTTRTRIMGILNLTPDSFYDGGRHDVAERAVARGLEMAEDGADMIDIGGESTRPGAAPVSAEDERARVIPVIEALTEQTGALISVDTMKAEVAREALAAGAHIVNDVSGFTADPEMMETALEFRPGVVLMHMQGEPRTMQKSPVYDDVVEEVRDYLHQRVDAAIGAGLEPASIVIDPGFGFGKTMEHNLHLFRGLERFDRRPVLVGISRKSFFQHLLGRPAEERLSGSLAAMAYAMTRGVRIFRVHDVKESCDVARVVDSMREENAHDEQPAPPTNIEPGIS
ncbi:MAG: dihydropteroate synthase [Verrucomicrobiota bacterium]